MRQMRSRFLHTTAVAVAVLLLGVVAGGLRAGEGSQPRPPWPPGVLPTPNEARPLAPSDALRTFHLPPGYRLEIVASEPLVQDPVAIDFDPRGRVWIVEMPGYMRDIAAGGEHEPIGRVVVLEDRDGDGRMDKRTVFAHGLVMARAIKVLDRGVLVGEPPHVWLMRDTNGDLRADAKEPVTDAFGRRDVDPQNNANGLYWAIDNWLHVAGQVDVSLRLKHGVFETRRTLRRGQWGVTQDDGGRVFRNTNESALHVDLVDSAYFTRNPNLLRSRGSYERLANDNPDLNVVWPARATPATNRAYQHGIRRADGSLARFTAVCAPLVYRGDRLPADLRGNVFVAEPAANLVSRIVLADEGGRLHAHKAYERGEFLASTDERFRPVALANGPDGTLYIVDMYRGILEHRLSMTEYLRDQIVARGLEKPVGMGRIYRVVHQTTRRDASPDLSNATSLQLVAALNDPSGWRRDTAQRLLVERLETAGDRDVAVRELTRLVESAPDWRGRLHALWTLDGIDALEPGHVARALADSAATVRAAGIRVAERWLALESHTLHAAVLERHSDKDLGVRRQMAASIGALPPAARAEAAAIVLETSGDDPIVVDAAISGLRGNEAAVLTRLLKTPPATSAREAAVAMLSGTIVRGAQDDAVQPVLGWIAETQRPEWQRSALLLGAEVALLGAPMPGTPVVRTASTDLGAPCPACPGGRAGPGGAYAYPRPAVASAPALLRLRLNREPLALTRLARPDPLTSRVDNVLARISWPGKPGEPVAVPPLTADEQRRFDAGHEVYRNVCQACHQADGRGQDRMAPSLVGSILTLGPPEIPVRILLHGKEGAFGLMPPIGATLSDDQIAGVLTYVRREWGQAASPVEASAVRSIRASTAGRSRPWTDAELMKLVEDR